MSKTDSKRGPISETPVVRIISRFRDSKTDSNKRKTPRSNVSAPRPEVAPEVEGRWPLPGLAPMTRVETSFGKVHAVALRKGDPVKTRDGEFRKIVWLNRVLLDETLLSEKPDANPVLIAAGAMGPSSPAKDVMVSPRQQVCPTSMNSLESRAEAAALEGRAGVARQMETGLSYTMFHLGAPAEVECDGVYLLFEPPGTAGRG